MSLTRRKRRAAAESAQPAPVIEPVPATPVTKSAWTDGFGLVAVRAVQIIAVVVLLAGAIWLLRTLSIVVIPILIALILASAFAPVMRWLRSKGVHSALAATLALLAIVLVLGGVGWLITVAVRNQWEDLSTSAQEGFTQLMDWVQHLPFDLDQAQIDEWLAAAQDFLTSAQFGSGALAGVSAVTSAVTGLVLMVVILFFFLKDGPQIWAFVTRPFRGSAEARAERIGVKAVDTMGAYVRGTAAVAAVDAIGIGIGLAICQVPLALPLAVLVFILAFIPIVGATLAGILAALVALVDQGPVVALIVVGIVIGVNQLEGNFLQPVLMGRSLKLHSLVILLALAIGTAVGGILGAILAVPITAVAWGIIQVWDGPNLPAKWARPKAKKEVAAA